MQNTIPYPIDDEDEEDFIDEDEDEEIDEDFFTDSERTKYQEYGD
jgi:hypothetical protein